MATRDATKLSKHHENGEEQTEAEERLGLLAYKTTMLTGLQLCPHCNKRVSRMSKCTAQGYEAMYHVDLLNREPASADFSQFAFGA